jgi:hypothetical protein
MSKSKLIFAILLIILLSAFLSGCDLFGFDLSDGCCFSGLLPLPLAVVGVGLFLKKP